MERGSVVVLAPKQIAAATLPKGQPAGAPKAVAAPVKGPATPAGGQNAVTIQAKRPVPAVVPAKGPGAGVVPAKRPVQVPMPAEARAASLRAWPEFVDHGEFLSTMRRTRRRRFLGRIALFVALPTLLTILYVFLFATPRYVTEFEITYQAYQSPQSLSTGLVQTLLGGGGAGVDLGSIVYEYIRSPTLLAKLDAKLHLKDYYSQRPIDYLTRLSADASDETFLSYYRRHVISVSEEMGGYLTVDVQAFDPNFALALAQAITQACDEMIDNLSARARQDEVRFAEAELHRQEDRVLRARQAMTQFQNVHGDLSPQDVANQLGQIAGTLEASLSKARTELANTLTFAQPTAPQVVNLKSQIASLEKQLAQQRTRLANTTGNTPYSQILDEYSRLQLEQEFAKDAYLSAQQGLSVARADAARKQNYLVDFISPSQPDQPTFWFSITYIATAFLGSLFIYAVGSLIMGAFRDQAGL